MKLARFTAPTLAATAVLLISGAGIAFAGSPAPVALTAPLTQAEPAGADNDQVQEGDQTTPDAAGGATTKAATSKAATNAVTTKAATSKAATVPAAAETGSESATETPEGTGTEADGPGGHEDPAGQNVDHQFEGVE